MCAVIKACCELISGSQWRKEYLGHLSSGVVREGFNEEADSGESLMTD